MLNRTGPRTDRCCSSTALQCIWLQRLGLQHTDTAATCCVYSAWACSGIGLYASGCFSQSQRASRGPTAAVVCNYHPVLSHVGSATVGRKKITALLLRDVGENGSGIGDGCQASFFYAILTFFTVQKFYIATCISILLHEMAEWQRE